MPTDPVNSTIDSQSGRFEFFKHIVTLSAAGLAGMAALFTDPAKIPTDVFSKATLIWCGLFFAATLLACLLGISTYSNLLLAISAEVEADTPLKSSAPLPTSHYADRIVHYARITLVTLLLSGLGLLIFAVQAMFREPRLGPEAALEATQQIIRKLNNNTQPVRLQHLGYDGETYMLHVVQVSDGLKYTIKLSRTGQLREITEEAPSEPRGGQAPPSGSHDGEIPSGRPLIADGFKIFGTGPKIDFGELAKAVTTAAADAGPEHIKKVIEGVGAGVDVAKKTVGFASALVDFYRKVFPEDHGPAPPPPNPPPPIEASTLLDREVNFAFNSAELDSGTRQELESVATRLRQHATPVLIEGHADGKGTSDYNVKLSQRRAEAVKDFLINQGIPSRDLHPYGYGQGYFWLPWTRDDDANRRVRIIECKIERLGDRCTGAPAETYGSKS